MATKCRLFAPRVKACIALPAHLPRVLCRLSTGLAVFAALTFGKSIAERAASKKTGFFAQYGCRDDTRRFSFLRKGRIVAVNLLTRPNRQ